MGLAQALELAVAAAVAGEQKPGVFFSGGVDSSVLAFLARKANPQTVLLIAGVEGSEDLRKGRENAVAMGFAEDAVIPVVLGDKEIIALLGEAREETGETDLMKLELSVVLLALCKRACTEGITVALSGSGAEELFLGYAAHRAAFDAGGDLEALRKRELAELPQKDIERNSIIAAYSGVTLVLPFLDPDVVQEALSRSAASNFSVGENKAVLRDAARSLGIPEQASGRQKRAMQYGSGVHASIYRLERTKKINV